jgi:hypothetical protein
MGSQPSSSPDGCNVGAFIVGREEGDRDDGLVVVGAGDGPKEGIGVTGRIVGTKLGVDVVGDRVGIGVGIGVGCAVGLRLGVLLGFDVGLEVG